MTIELHDANDLTRLAELAGAEENAKQRDRYRAVLLAGRGEDGAELFREQIAQRVGRSRQFVDEWVGRYRRDGIAALTARKQPGAACKLAPERREQLKQMLEAGPAEEEGLAAYNGPILKEKIEETFGVAYALSGVYKLLHELGYNDLMPRPRHPQSDPVAQEKFKKKRCRRR